MTSELEQKFYNTFGIEEKENLNYTEKGFIEHTYSYPDITAEKLLEMICIYNSTYTNGFTNYSLLNERSTEELKGHILRNCLKVRDDVYNQIQQLFKGEI